MVYGKVYDQIPDKCPKCGNNSLSIEKYKAHTHSNPRYDEENDTYIPPMTSGEDALVVCNSCDYRDTYHSRLA